MNFEESLSTLRYADRAKKIQNKAVVNESAQDKLIRELKAENEQLKKALRDAVGADGMVNAKDFLEMMDHQDKAIDDIKNFDAKLQEQKEINVEKDVELEEKKKRENKRAPHLTNLNDDPMLSQQVYYGMVAFPVTVGRRNENPAPSIAFGGVNILKQHAQFNMLDNGLIALEIKQESALKDTFINGVLIAEGKNTQVLNHLDTIYLG